MEDDQRRAQQSIPELDARQQDSWTYGWRSWRARPRVKRVLSDAGLLAVGLGLVAWQIGLAEARQELVLAALLLFAPVGMLEVGSLLLELVGAPRKQRDALRAMVNALESKLHVYERPDVTVSRKERDAATRLREHLATIQYLLDTWKDKPEDQKSGWIRAASTAITDFDGALPYMKLPGPVMAAYQSPVSTTEREVPRNYSGSRSHQQHWTTIQYSGGVTYVAELAGREVGINEVLRLLDHNAQGS